MIIFKETIKLEKNRKMITIIKKNRKEFLIIETRIFNQLYKRHRKHKVMFNRLKINIILIQKYYNRG